MTIEKPNEYDLPLLNQHTIESLKLWSIYVFM